MTNETAEHSAVFRPNPRDGKAIEYFVILTVLEPLRGGGWEKTTLSYVTLVKPDTTREALIKQVDNEIPVRLRERVIMFFSAEPNQIPPGEYLVMATLEHAACDTGAAWLHRTTALTVPVGISRMDLYSSMQDRMSNAGQTGSLVFFSAEPNQVDTTA